jgi:molybdate transport system substrate-binding protein
MRIESRARRVAALATAVLLAAACAQADEIRVMTSGAFTAAYRLLVPEFERTSGHRVVTTYGASMGSGANTIPSRLQSGEQADLVIMAASALEDLINRGMVAKDSRVDLVRSQIGMAVRTGAAKPDISTVDALRQTLLNAKSIAYSSSASGVYLSTELFRRLGVSEAIKNKVKPSEGAVGELVARGEAEIGFQQISELLPVAGIDYVGPLPAEVQRETIFSIGIVARARAVDAARALIRFFTSSAAAPTIQKTGLEPILSR